jgi:hypothetical protein
MAVLAVALLGVAGCGEDNDRGGGFRNAQDADARTEDRGVKLPAYLDDARKVCVAHGTRLAEIAANLRAARDAGAGDAFLTSYQEVGRELGAMIDELSALRRPKSWRDELGDSYRQAYAAVDVFDSGAAALQGGDIGGGIEAALRGQRIIVRWAGSMTLLGAAPCAEAVAELDPER